MKITKKDTKNKKVFYDKRSDALWFFIKPGVEESYREIAPGINIELGKNDEVLGIEVLNASKVLKPILEEAYGREVPKV